MPGRYRTFFACLTIGCLAHVSGAAVVYVPFDNVAPPTGASFVTNANLLTGGSSLSYGQLQTTGGSLFSTGLTGTALATTTLDLASDLSSARAFDGNYSSTGVVWLSYLYKPTVSPPDWTRTYLNGNGGGQFGMFDNTNQRMGIRIGSAGTNASPNIPAVADATYFFTVRIDYGVSTTTNDNTVTLWINPNTTSLGTGSAPTGGSSVTLTSVPDAAVLGDWGLELRNGTTYDEFRIGSTWVDVSPVTNPSPEPTSLLILLLALPLTLRGRIRP